MVAPKGKAPKGGRPVVAWAHGTEGGGRNCVPSLVADPATELLDYFTYPSPFQQDVGVPALQQFLDAGYVIAATDYQGLGTPGAVQYTVLDTEIHNVFDSVRAAQGIDATAAGNKMVVLGWSQGGGASVAMAERSDYGKPLELLGVAGLAPAANSGPQLAGQTPPGPVNATSPFHAVALQLNVFNGFAAAYPDLEPADLVTDVGEQALEGAASQCVNHFAYVLNSNLTTPEGIIAVPSPVPTDWQQAFDENTPGYSKPIAPVLVMQGTADTVVNPNGTAQYIERVCGFGTPVQFTTYEGATHQTIPGDAQPEYVPWIADRFAGDDAPTNCGAPNTVTPPSTTVPAAPTTTPSG